MMNYRRRRSGIPTRIVWKIILAVVLIFVIFTGSRVPFLSRVALTLATPFWGVGDIVGHRIYVVGSYFASKQKLFNENETLRAQVADLEAEVFYLEVLRAENKILKDLTDSLPQSHVVAGVLGKPGRTLYDSLIIDRGSKDGILEGQKVYAGSTIPIGIVDEVTFNSSRVKLFSAHGESVEVVVKEGISTLAEGRGGGNFQIKLPRGSGIEVGDPVMFPGLSTEVVGVIEHVDSRPTDSFEVILFKSPVNIYELRWVFVERVE